MPTAGPSIRSATAPTEPRRSPAGALRNGSLPPPVGRDAALTVLDITKFFAPGTGGVRTWLLQKSEWLAGRPEVAHVVIVPGEHDAIRESGRRRWYALRGPAIPGSRPYRFLIAPRTISAILAHERPDVVEVGSHFLVPWQVMPAARRTGAALAWYCHTDLTGLAGGGWSGGPGRSRMRERWAERYVRALADRCDLVLAGSRFLADRLHSAGVARVEVAPLGVDLDRFHPAHREDAAALSDLGAPGARYALYAGRFAREKELDVVLRAWPEVERRTGVRLVLVGAGAARRRLLAVPAAGRATWLPFEPDRKRFARLVASAAMYVAPGPFETFGLAAAEAMASGVPVLSVDAGAVPEQVLPSGGGVVYPRGDAAGAAEAACTLLEGDPAAAGRRARAWAEARLGAGPACDRLVTLYRGLARREVPGDQRAGGGGARATSMTVRSSASSTP